MNFLGLQIDKTHTKYKRRRLSAFIVDSIVLCILLYICYGLFGIPDFPAVKISMDELSSIADPNVRQAASVTMLTLFNAAYRYTLILWFVYEIIACFILKGATIGKLLFGLQIISHKQTDSSIITYLRIIFRAFIKMVLTYFFQGMPFLISQLSILANTEGRAGVDIFAGTRVLDKRA